jgi:hypothetical protein
MNDESTNRRVRGRCVWWLSGQCTGGAQCTCLPVPRPDVEQRQVEPTGDKHKPA